MEQRFKFTIFTNFPLIRGFFGSSGAGVGSWWWSHCRYRSLVSLVGFS